MNKRLRKLALIMLGVCGCMAAHAQRVVFPHVYAPSEGLVNKTETTYRHEVCLNGYWDFQPVKLPASFKYGTGNAPELTKPTADGWVKNKLKVPSPWNVNDFAYRNLEGPDHRNYPSYPDSWKDVKMAWMRKTVKVPATWNNEVVKLHFEAVAGKAEVYVNGNKVGENFDLFLPFDFDVTQYAKPGTEIEVLVGVRSQWLFENRGSVGRRILPGGSMWGTNINGIWQDVYLYAVPKVHVADIFVKPSLSKHQLEIEATIENNTGKPVTLTLNGDVKEWINKAGKDMLSAPVPAWNLGATALTLVNKPFRVAANGKQVVKLVTNVKDGMLKTWTPEAPNLYGLLLSVKEGKKTIDLKYERFGWREWTLQGTKQLLNGKVYPLRGDSWHFMGIPQMTRRYAWSWYTAIKNMNGNAVRLHAQVYPRLYMDMADEMGICILDETANWGSDGGPKLDSPLFWENSKDHLRRFVQRDRNHASVFGWSISNENKPVILYVYSRPDLMPQQEQAWKDWRDIVKAEDPTRPWISSDGEDDGNGILPVTVGHYGDLNSMKNWIKIGKPWGIGEHSMAYYGTPEQVSKYNGERAYESMEGRMEGLAEECYGLIRDQRNMGASYSTIFNMVWYGLKPLPLGKKDLTKKPTLQDGIFFDNYVEGQPGVQPERVGPYSTTFNPGYDPNLPLYQTWPMFDALKAANASGGPAPCQWDKAVKVTMDTTKLSTPLYKEVVFLGDANSAAKQMLDAQGVIFSAKVKKPALAMVIVDGSKVLSAENAKTIAGWQKKGANLWIVNPTPETVASFVCVLPAKLEIDNLKRSSYLPTETEWTKGLTNSDFYFCELQNEEASRYTLKGDFVNSGKVMLNACKTNWRNWNKRAEEIKTAGVLRSEYETTQALPVIVGNGKVVVSTLENFANSEKGYKTLSVMLRNAGIVRKAMTVNPAELFFERDGKMMFPVVSRDRLTPDGEGYKMVFYVYSNRPLDDLLIEPNVPKVTLFVKTIDAKLLIGDKSIKPAINEKDKTEFYEIPLQQGWNKLTLTIPGKAKQNFEAHFRCDNRKEFLPTMKAMFNNPEKK